jgi:hypothetical protein
MTKNQLIGKWIVVIDPINNRRELVCKWEVVTVTNGARPL